VALSGDVHLRALSRLLALGLSQTSAAVAYWERHGIVSSERQNYRRMIQLNRNFIAFEELTELLEKIDVCQPQL
jgi:hypothetical protein